MRTIEHGQGPMAQTGIRQQRGAPGFSLIELMVVVSIVAILAAIAYPSYQNQIAAGRRSDAQAELMQFAQFMERLYTETGCYNPGADNDCGSGAPGAPDIDGIDTAHYEFDFASGEPTASTFEIIATPTGPQAGDGELRIDEQGRRSWDENNDGSIAAHERDWVRN
jgi:type IV pilus assembly protein PilE